MIDEDRARAHAGEGPVFAQADRPEVVVVADAGEHELAVLPGLPRPRRAAPAESLDPPRGDRGGPVVDDDVVARCPEMPGHGKSHHAKADECDIAHGCLSLLG